MHPALGRICFAALASLEARGRRLQRHGMEVEDLSGDGLLDMAVSSEQGGTEVAVHRHDAVSLFLAYERYGTSARAGVGLGDVLGGDCRDDAVASLALNSPTSLTIWSQDPSGRLTGPAAISTHDIDIPEPVEVADLYGDGREDVAVAHAVWMRLGLYLRRPGGGLDAEQLCAIPYAAHSAAQGLAVGDFTSDGSADVAIADYNNGLVVLHGQGCAPACVASDALDLTLSSAPPAADAGPDLLVCAGDPIRLDGSLTSACPAPATNYYRWLDAAGEVCSWSTAPTCQVVPGGDGTYTLEAACALPPACVETDTVDITQRARPFLAIPPARTVCAGQTVVLDASGSGPCPSAGAFRDSAGVWPPPYREGLSGPGTREPDIPWPPHRTYYRAAGASRSGQEGP